MARIMCLALAALLSAFLLSGCELAETTYNSGQVDRLRLDAGSNWKRWDLHSPKEDDHYLLLKSEKTF
jgi:hypothetical protein